MDTYKAKRTTTLEDWYGNSQEIVEGRKYIIEDDGCIEDPNVPDDEPDMDMDLFTVDYKGTVFTITEHVLAEEFKIKKSKKL